MDKGKGIALLLMGKKKPMSGEGEESDSEDSPKELAAKSLIKAVKADSPEMVVEAFETLMEACKGYEGEEEE